MNTNLSKYEVLQGEVNQSLIVSRFMTKVYGWMSAALFLTAFTAWVVSENPAMVEAMVNSRFTFFLLIAAQLGLVVAITAAINKISGQTAALLFVVYSTLTGLTLSFIFLAFTAESIATTFVVTAGTFAIMSIYGMVTKRDLTKMGSLLFMVLIGLVIASVVNIFLASSGLYWIITYAGVLVFVGLAAYDTQKLKNMCLQQTATNEEATYKLAILGALTLYLDFINLFLFLLRLFGQRK